jgi:hypothetical protein
METFIFILLIPIIRGLIFFFDWRYLAKVYDQHHLYLQGAFDSSSPEAREISRTAGDWLTENSTEIKRRVEKSGISNPTHTFMEAKGYGFAGQEQMTTLDNLLYLNKNIQSSAIEVLKRARGHFKNEALRSINPAFWLETIFFLPKAIISASGINTSSKLADIALKITQVVYWVIILTAVIFNPELIGKLIESIRT